MTLRPGEARGRAIAVFPFLKTSEPVRLGDFTFRSTDDTTDLSREDSDHVREVADMLFLQDDLRIRSAAYAMLPARRLWVASLGEAIGGSVFMSPDSPRRTGTAFHIGATYPKRGCGSTGRSTSAMPTAATAFDFISALIAAALFIGNGTATQRSHRGGASEQLWLLCP
jgi:hypothetical protein